MKRTMKYLTFVIVAAAACGSAALLHAESSPAMSPATDHAIDNGHYQLFVDGSGHYAAMDTRSGKVWTTESNSGGWKQVMDAVNEK